MNGTERRPLPPAAPPPVPYSWIPAIDANGEVTDEQFCSLVPPQDTEWPYVSQLHKWAIWPNLKGLFVASHASSQERQGFLTAMNRPPTGWVGGDCLWRSLAYIIYGSGEFFPYIKAEHRRFCEEARQAGDHFIHHRLLNTISNVVVPTSAEDLEHNLRWPSATVPSQILEITALLYRVCVVEMDFTTLSVIPPDTVVPVIKYYGSRNREQIFLGKFSHSVANDNSRILHYQPMIPDVERPDEYRWKDIDNLPATSETRHFKTTRKLGIVTEVPLPLPWRNIPPSTLEELKISIGVWSKNDCSNEPRQIAKENLRVWYNKKKRHGQEWKKHYDEVQLLQKNPTRQQNGIQLPKSGTSSEGGKPVKKQTSRHHKGGGSSNDPMVLSDDEPVEVIVVDSD